MFTKTSLIEIEMADYTAFLDPLILERIFFEREYVYELHMVYPSGHTMEATPCVATRTK